ncbi:MAG: hypothetical protein LBG24_07915 [Treponema sp.]|jgi:hypothetical protein|nr:hypothetical protein [Treponema sp.]
MFSSPGLVLWYIAKTVPKVVSGILHVKSRHPLSKNRYANSEKTVSPPLFPIALLKKRKRKLRKNFLVFTHYLGNFFTKTLGTPCGGGPAPGKNDETRV